MIKTLKLELLSFGRSKICVNIIETGNNAAVALVTYGKRRKVVLVWLTT